MPHLILSRRALIAGAVATLMAMPTFADDDADMHNHGHVDAGDFILHAPYIRVTPQSAAAFFRIENVGDQDDRLIGASSPIAKKVELHTHIMADGVARMRPIEGGIALPEAGMHELARGGDHVMFMGLNTHPANGDMVEVTLSFEKAGDITVEIPVDNERTGSAMGHMNMDGDDS